MSESVQTDAKAVEEAVSELDDLAANALGGAEGLDRASCSPVVTYLAQIGIGAYSRGCSSAGWRMEVAKIRGADAARELDEAEKCMRKSGLWPWA